MKLREKERREIYQVLNRKEVKNWYFDTETFTQLNEEGTHIADARVYGVGWLNDRNDFRCDYSPTTSLRTFLKDLANQSGEIILWAHNATYDLPFLLREIVEGNHDLKKGKAKFTEEGVLINCDLEGNNLKVKVGCTGFWDRTMSLKDWSKSLVTQKLELGDVVKYNVNESLQYLDKNFELKEFNRVQEATYLKNDVMIIPEIIEVIDDFKDSLSKVVGLTGNNNLRVKYKANRRVILSKASASKDCFSSCLHKDDGSPMDFDERYRPELNDINFYNSIERGYLGGFTAGNPAYMKVDDPNIKVYDINSMYPSIMSKGIPGGLPSKKAQTKDDIHGVECIGTFCNGKKEWEIFDNQFLGKTFFTNMLRDNYCPSCAALRKENKRRIKGCPHCKKMAALSSFVILKETYDLMEELCDHDIQIIQHGYQGKCDQISGFIEGNYRRRMQIKQAMKEMKPDDPKYDALDSEQESIKIVMNSLYGKLAERHHPLYLEISKEDPYLRTKDNESCTPCILSGSYVTAKARIMLMKGIRDEVLNGNTFLYCDTDSIFFIDNSKTRSIEVNDEKLGAGKEEGTFTSFRYLGKHKKYLLYNQAIKNKLYKEHGEERVGASGKLPSKFIKMAIAGISCKQEIMKWNFQDLEKVFDPKCNVCFVNCKTAPIPVDDRFGISALRKVNYQTNPETTDINGKKVKRAITHIVREPYTKLEVYGEEAR